MQLYVTFGQDHHHVVDGKVFDKYTVACIECVDEEAGRKRAFELFGPKFCFSYREIESNLHYYPKGIIKI